MCPLWNFENEHLANLIAPITDRAVALKKNTPHTIGFFKAAQKCKKENEIILNVNRKRRKCLVIITVLPKSTTVYPTGLKQCLVIFYEALRSS